MNNRPAKRDGCNKSGFPSPKDLNVSINGAIYTFNPFRVGKNLRYHPVDCIYGYSYSTPSALSENALLLISHSLSIIYYNLLIITRLSSILYLKSLEKAKTSMMSVKGKLVSNIPVMM